MYHQSSRCLQDKFDSRRVADRLAEVQAHTLFTLDDRALIEKCAMFFLATADAEGYPDCSYKGGMPGFLRVLDEQTLAFPDYNGNGMFRSLGNILTNPHVGLLFVDFENPQRLRVNGTASVHLNDPLLPEYPGAQAMVRIQVKRIFPNCARYVHRMKFLKPSVYVPRPGHTPPVPGWKKWDEFREILPADEGKIQPDLHTFFRRLEQRGVMSRFFVGAIRKVKQFLTA